MKFGPYLFWICKNQWWCSLFLFQTRKPFWSKLGPKTQFFLLIVNFGTLTNSNKQYSMAILTFSALDWKYSFLANLVGKSRIVSFSWNVEPTVIFITFWDFLMFYQTFLSPQVKRCAIITYKHGIYEFSHELPNDWRLRTLEN